MSLGKQRQLQNADGLMVSKYRSGTPLSAAIAVAQVKIPSAIKQVTRAPAVSIISRKIGTAEASMDSRRLGLSGGSPPAGHRGPFRSESVEFLEVNLSIGVLVEALLNVLSVEECDLDVFKAQNFGKFEHTFYRSSKR